MQNNPLKFIFFGTSDFAEIILNKLLANNYRPVAVVTQPDQPIGRKKILTPPPVKILAQKHNLQVIQPQQLDDDFAKELSSFNPELSILVAYGKIIPQKIIDLPKYKTINIHPSLLPKYRGPAPIQFALLNNDKTSGTTIMLIDEKVDHGPILAQQSIPIQDKDTYLTLSDKLAQTSADLLIKTIPEYTSGKIKPQPQDHQQSTLTKIIHKQDGQITPQQTAQEIYNAYRAYQPWPGIFGQLTASSKQLTIKLLDIELTPLNHQKNSPLELFVKDKNLYLACANQTTLKINQLQPQGKNIMSAQSFINGYLTI